MCNYKYSYKGYPRIRQEITDCPTSNTEIINYFHDNAGNLILEDDDSPNILENPGFETGDKTGWGQWEGDFNWSVTSQQSQEGKYCLYSPFFQSMGTTELMIQHNSLSEVKKPFTASVWVKTQNLSGGVKVMVDFWSADWSQSFGGKSSAIITGTNNWMKISVTINPGDIPSGAANFKFHIARMLGGGKLWVDNARCESGSERTPPKKYFYAGNRLLAKDEDGHIYYYHLDRLGSPIMITDEDDIVKEKSYESFGTALSSTGVNEDNRDFTGKEKDKSGFNYFGARYYSSSIGRFLTPDPHTLMPGGLKLANPQELNPYVYCLNAPLTRVDPNGLWSIDVAFSDDRSTTGRLYLRNRQGIVVKSWDALGRGNHRDRMAENGDTPYGTYDITGRQSTSKLTGKKLSSFGPNGKILLDPKSGEAKKSNRDLFRIHGGKLSEATEELRATNGCIRLSNDDMKDLTGQIDELEKNDSEETPEDCEVMKDPPQAIFESFEPEPYISPL